MELFLVGLPYLLEETQKSWVQKAAIFKPGREQSPEKCPCQDPHFGPPAPEQRENRCLLFKSLSPWYFVMETLAAESFLCAVLEIELATCSPTKIHCPRKAVFNKEKYRIYKNSFSKGRILEQIEIGVVNAQLLFIVNHI